MSFHDKRLTSLVEPNRKLSLDKKAPSSEAANRRTSAVETRADVIHSSRRSSTLLTSEETDGSSHDATPPRYHRRLAKKIRSLRDGDVARFQVGSCCFMTLKIGDELFIRPFGEGAPLCVNGTPITEMTKLSLDDLLTADGRRFVLRPVEVGSDMTLSTVNRLLAGRGTSHGSQGPAPWN